MIQLPKYDTTIIEYEPLTFIPRAPPQSVIFPRNDKVNAGEAMLEMDENSDMVSDYIQMVPRSVNQGNSISFGSNLYSNTALKKLSTSTVLGTFAKEPMYVPPGGFQYIFPAQMQSDLYNLNQPLRDPIAVVPNLRGIDQNVYRQEYTKPLPVRTTTDVQPNIVYNVSAAPQIDGADQHLVDKISGSYMNPIQGRKEVNHNFDTQKYMANRLHYDVVPSLVYHINGYSNIPIIGHADDLLTDKLNVSVVPNISCGNKVVDHSFDTRKYITEREILAFLAPVVSDGKAGIEIGVILKETHEGVNVQANLTSDWKQILLYNKELEDRRLKVNMDAPLSSQYHATARNDCRELTGTRDYVSVDSAFQLRPDAIQTDFTEVSFNRQPKLIVAAPSITVYPWA